MTSQKSISILIVDDHKLTNECLKLGLEKESDMTISGQAFDGVSAVEMARQLKPTVILMDVCMPNQNGIQATAAIKKLLPEVKVIMTTSMMDKKVVQAAFAANADGYCTKDTQLSSLIHMIRTVLGGAVCIDPKVALYAIREIAGVADMDSIKTPEVKPLPVMPHAEPVSQVQELPHQAPSMAKSIPVFEESQPKENKAVEKPKPNLSIPVFTMSPADVPASPALDKKTVERQQQMLTASEAVAPIHGKIADHLTQRELEILKLIADNHSNDEIARNTGLSSAWLASHIKNILLKLSVTNEVQAIRRALDEGLIEDAPLLHQH